MRRVHRSAPFLAILVALLLFGPGRRACAEPEHAEALTTRELAWAIGERTGMTLLSHVAGAKVEVKTRAASLGRLAQVAGVTVPPLPTVTGNRRLDVQAFQAYLLRGGVPQLRRALVQKYDDAHGALFLVSVNIRILSKVYTGGRPIVAQLIADTRKVMTAMGVSTRSLERVLARMEKKADSFEVQMAVGRYSGSVRIALSEEEGKRLPIPLPPGTPPPPRRATLWKLGMTTVLASHIHLQGKITGPQDSVLVELRTLTGELGVAMPEFSLPAKKGNVPAAFGATYMKVVAEWGFEISLQMRERYGHKYGLAFEIPLKVNWLLAPPALLGPLPRGINAFLKQAAPESGLPKKVWSPVAALVDLKAPHAALRKAVFKMNDDAVAWLEQHDAKRTRDLAGIRYALSAFEFGRQMSEQMYLGLSQRGPEPALVAYRELSEKAKALGLQLPAWKRPDGALAARRQSFMAFVSDSAFPEARRQLRSRGGPWQSGLFGAAYFGWLIRRTYMPARWKAGSAHLLERFDEELAHADLPKDFSEPMRAALTGTKPKRDVLRGIIGFLERTTRHLEALEVKAPGNSMYPPDGTLAALSKRIKPGVAAVTVYDAGKKVLRKGVGFFVRPKQLVVPRSLLAGAKRVMVVIGSRWMPPVPAHGILAEDPDRGLALLSVGIDARALELDTNVPPEVRHSTKLNAPPHITRQVALPKGVVGRRDDLGRIRRRLDGPDQKPLMPEAIEFSVLGRIEKMETPTGLGTVYKVRPYAVGTLSLPAHAHGAPLVDLEGRVLGVLVGIGGARFGPQSFLVQSAKDIQRLEPGTLQPFDTWRVEHAVAGKMSWRTYRTLLWMMRGGDRAQARKIVSEALPHDAENPQLLFWSGVLAEKTDEGKKAFEAAIRLRPDFAEAHYQLGQMLGSAGQLSALLGGRGLKLTPTLSKAMEHYKLAVQHDPSHALAHTRLGVNYRLLGKYPEAIQSLQAAVRADPDVEGAHFSLGLAQWRTRQYDRALDSLRAAVRAEPYDLKYRSTLAEMLTVSDRHGEAVGHYIELNRINKGHGSLLLNTLLK